MDDRIVSYFRWIVDWTFRWPAKQRHLRRPSLGCCFRSENVPSWPNVVRFAADSPFVTNDVKWEAEDAEHALNAPNCSSARCATKVRIVRVQGPNVDDVSGVGGGHRPTVSSRRQGRARRWIRVGQVPWPRWTIRTGRANRFFSFSILNLVCDCAFECLPFSLSSDDWPVVISLRWNRAKQREREENVNHESKIETK